MTKALLSLIVAAPVLVLVIAVAGCSKEEPARLEEALTLFRQNKLEEALPLLEELVAREEKNAEEHIWLAETYRRLRRTEEAIEQARIALELEPCNSFAYTVMADASVPPPGDSDIANSQTSWDHLLKAIECDSTEGNAWVSIWGFAIRRGETEMLRTSLRKMVETRFLTDAALSFGRWLLRTLPENAILITNGDVDTYPAMAVQEAEGFRTDVTVVERGLLNLPWGLRFVRDDGGVPLPYQDSELDTLSTFRGADGSAVHPADRVFQGWVAGVRLGSYPRPITLAVTVYEEFYTGVKEYLQYAGPYFLLEPAPVVTAENVSALRECINGIEDGDFIGPWVSKRDYSPIRGLYTKEIVRNVTHAALVYAEALIEEKGYEEAEKMLSWAEDFEERTELGPVYGQRIQELRENLARKR
ncbi:MAG: tetratricopeptide repeat protein [Bacteroidetes bacterium]|nr:tetratricopeptide repeat protein [Bacteroidota bacterium]